jgi:uncharacterized integral membrane protein
LSIGIAACASRADLAPRNRSGSSRQHVSVAFVGKQARPNSAVTPINPQDYDFAISTLDCGVVLFRKAKEVHSMRWIHLAVIALFAVATVLFAVQNFQIVTMSFLGFSVRAPLSLLVVIVYVLGMATGGSLWALLRRSFRGSQLTNNQ